MYLKLAYKMYRLFNYCFLVQCFITTTPMWKALSNPELLLLEIQSWGFFSSSLASHKQTNPHASVMLVTSKQLH